MDYLNTTDIIVISAYLIFVIITGLYFRKRASGSLENFILGGKRLPWYLAGISMVATTFAADTPLFVTEVVAKDGISGNWVWWHFMIGGLLTTLIFARLWRRSGVLTEAEFISLRYSGRPAHWLRVFKAGYLGFFMNALIMCWVNYAMVTILGEIFGLSKMNALWAVSGLMAIVILYSSLSGLLGVVYTDFVQFILAFGGCIVLAVFVVQSDQIGGIEGLKEKLPPGSLKIFPNLTEDLPNTWHLPIASFLAYTGIMWWSSWYPGAEPGGGGYIAQRMMSARSEKDAYKATLLFQILNYCVRPWPWIVVALGTIILYPQLGEPGKPGEAAGFVMAMNDFLPGGWKGLLLVAFMGAYMSTISTQLNWGVGLLVNDMVLPLSKEKISDKKQVSYGRIGTIALGVISLWISQYMMNIKGVMDFVMQCGAGLGFVLIARWLYWRINAWTEIAATITPFLMYLLNQFFISKQEGFESFGQSVFVDPSGFFLVVGATILVSLVVMLLTKPDSQDRLNEFYDRVRPFGIWKGMDNYENRNKLFLYLLVTWVITVIMAYSVLFVISDLIFQTFDSFVLESSILLGSLIILYILSKKTRVLG